MYAVIKTGGKQYRIAKQQFLKIEKIEAEVGSKIKLEQVLMIVDDQQVNIGSPLISGAVVTAEILSHGRAKKINIIKFKRRKHHRKQMGHRQYFTEIKIIDITGAKASAKAEPVKKATKPTQE